MRKFSIKVLCINHIYLTIFVDNINSEIGITKDGKIFSIGNCDSCKRRFFFNVYSYYCSKCEYTLCQSAECKLKSENLICMAKKEVRSTRISPVLFKRQEKLTQLNGLECIRCIRYSSLSKINSSALFYLRSKAFKRKWQIDQVFSDQLIPVNEFKLPPRIRSFSDPEINLTDHFIQV
jgi:hypothetical protein